MADDNNNNNNFSKPSHNSDGNKNPTPTLLSDNLKANQNATASTYDNKNFAYFKASNCETNTSTTTPKETDQEQQHQQFPLTKAHLNCDNFNKPTSPSPLTTTNFNTDFSLTSPYASQTIQPQQQQHQQNQQQNLVWNENVPIYPAPAAASNTHQLNYGASLQANQIHNQQTSNGSYDWSMPAQNFNSYSNEYHSSNVYPTFGSYPAAQYQRDYYEITNSYYQQHGTQAHQTYVPNNKLGSDLTGNLNSNPKPNETHIQNLILYILVYK